MYEMMFGLHSHISSGIGNVSLVGPVTSGFIDIFFGFSPNESTLRLMYVKLLQWCLCYCINLIMSSVLV